MSILFLYVNLYDGKKMRTLYIIFFFAIYIRNRRLNKGNNKITELRTILQRESQNS
jgi:hypothetical protein